MKIYLAGNFPIMIVPGRERELSEKMSSWKRLFSFYYMDLLYKSDIIKIKKDENILSDMVIRRKSGSISNQKKI